jgi:hypothetical protein
MIEMPVIVQLLTNNADERVVVKKTISNDGIVKFDYLKPEKYKVKFIYDRQWKW